MKLETRMYIRTNDGISKIIEVRLAGSLSRVVDDFGNVWFAGEILGTSYEVIDLIEKGDYINGVWVNEFKNGKPFHEDYSDPFYSYG